METKPKRNLHSTPALVEMLEERTLLSTVSTTTNLALSTSTSTLGQTVTMTATVIPSSTNSAPLTGIVRFFSGSTLIGQVPVDSDGSDGLATISLYNLFGTNDITAKYKGNSTYANSNSAVQDLQVNFEFTSGSSGSDETYVAQAGTGATFDTDGDAAQFEYTGYTNNTAAPAPKFDSSLNPSRTPFDLSYTDGAVSGVITGFATAAAEMSAGEILVVKIPPSLGYGSSGSGTSIPGNSRLWFILDCMSISPSTDSPNLVVEGPNTNTSYTVTSGAAAQGLNGTDFGAVQTGTTVTETFTLFATSPLFFTQDPAMVVAGPDAGQYSIGTLTPVSGSPLEETFTVTFSPTETGVLDGRIKIFTNDPVNPTFIIQLQGEGVTTGVAASAAKFGNTPITAASAANASSTDEDAELLDSKGLDL